MAKASAERLAERRRVRRAAPHWARHGSRRESLSGRHALHCAMVARHLDRGLSAMAVNNVRRRLLMHQQVRVAAAPATDGPAPSPATRREESAARQPARQIEGGVQHEASVAEPPRPGHWFQARNPGRPKGAKDKCPRKARTTKAGPSRSATSPSS